MATGQARLNIYQGLFLGPQGSVDTFSLQGLQDWLRRIYPHHKYADCFAYRGLPLPPFELFIGYGCFCCYPFFLFFFFLSSSPPHLYSIRNKVATKAVHHSWMLNRIGSLLPTISNWDCHSKYIVHLLLLPIHALATSSQPSYI